LSFGRFFLTKLGIEPGLTSVVVTRTHERFYMSMADLISVEAAITWRWRCQSEGIVVFGPDLRVAESPATSRLAEWRSPEVDREKLRCACGGCVFPLAPIDIE